LRDPQADVVVSRRIHSGVERAYHGKELTPERRARDASVVAAPQQVLVGIAVHPGRAVRLAIAAHGAAARHHRVGIAGQRLHGNHRRLGAQAISSGQKYEQVALARGHPGVPRVRHAGARGVDHSCCRVSTCDRRRFRTITVADEDDLDVRERLCKGSIDGGVRLRDVVPARNDNRNLHATCSPQRSCRRARSRSVTA
jgi:hypothetical protein